MNRILKYSLACGATLLCAASARADYASTMAGLKPFLYYRLNDTTPVPTPDQALNKGSLGAAANGGYTGTAGATFTHPGANSVLGAANAAANFAGGYVLVPRAEALNSAAFTVEGWFNPATAFAEGSGTLTCPLSCGDFASPRAGWLFYQTETNWNFRMYTGVGTGTGLNIYGGSAPVAGTWYHLAVVYDGTNATMYVNGSATTSAKPSTYVPGKAGGLAIGARADVAFQWYGDADEVAYFTNALPAAAIKAHYDAATTNAAGYGAQLLAQNPVGYWRLDEPAWEEPGVYPVAVNSGTNGVFDASYKLGTTTQQPGVPTAAFGTPNYAAKFDRTYNGQVEIPGLMGAMGGVNGIEMTFTGWIKRNGSQTGWSALIFQRNGSGTATGLTFGDANELRMTWNDAEYTWVPSPALNVPDNVWTFVAAVVTATNTTLYMNNQSASHAVTHAVHDFSNGLVYLGFDPSAANRHFNGWMDEVAIFDYALSPAQISQLYSAGQIPPVITQQPQGPADQVYEGGSITMSVVADGFQPLSYQWTKNGAKLSGKTAATFSAGNLATADSGNYAVVITNLYGAVTSSVVAITVAQGPPVVLTPPQSMSRYLGAAATFTVVPGGSLPWSFQWNKGGSPISGATAVSYTIPAVTAADAGSYNVTITNPYGNTNTTAATLTILPTTNYASAIVQNGAPPVAYWRLDETTGTNAFDYAGGFTGTNNGPVVLGQAGPRPAAFPGFETTNNAYQLDGAATCITAKPLNTSMAAATAVGWVYMDVPQNNTAHFLSQRGSVSGDTFGFHVEGTGLNLRYTWGEDAGTYNWNSGLSLPLSQWTFVALVVTPSQAIMYMDPGTGLVAATNNHTHGTLPFGGVFNIGRDARGDRYWTGLADEVAVYNYALSAADIANLDLMAVTGPTPPAIIAQPASQTVFAGQAVTLSFGAQGAPPFTYQWTHSGTNLPGATAKALVIPSAYYTDAGAYTVKVANGKGNQTSQAAVLTVLPMPAFCNFTNDLLLHLKFDNDYQDASGRANHGAAVGTPTFVAGKIGGQALHYNTEVGSAYNYVTLGMPADLQFGTDTNFTVSYWVKLPANALSGDLPFLCSANNSYGGFGWTFAPSYNAGGWSYYVGDSSGSVGLYGAANSINDGNWHHLLHSFNRTNNAVTYLDGLVVDSRPMSSVLYVDSGNVFNIGQDPSGTYGETGEATIDDLGIWRQAFSPTEAQSVYLVGKNAATSFDTYGPVTLTLKPAVGGLELIWQAGTLMEASSLTGPWTPVAGATAPFFKTTSSAGQKFYRVKL